MKSVTRVVTLVAAGALVACSDSTSVESPVGPQLEVAGNSACFTANCLRSCVTMRSAAG